MTKKDLKKLSRLDLIEMLLTLTRENEQLRGELDQARKQLEDRTIAVENVGSLAEATLCLNGVMESAQAAADQYLQNIRLRSDRQDQECARMEQATREKCDRMVQSAKDQVDDYLHQINTRLREVCESYTWKSVLPDEAKDSET